MGELMNKADIELSYEDFVCARKLHWKNEATKAGSEIELPKFDEAELRNDASTFMLYSSRPDGILAVFEDSGDVGWFYLFEAARRKILKGAHIYNRSDVAPTDDVVDIGWGADDSACGIALWGQFRAFLGVHNDLQIRKRVLSADEDGIPSSEWPAGFEHYLEPRDH